MAGRHFGFFKRAGRHKKGAGRRALQKKPRQNTADVVDPEHRVIYRGQTVPLIIMYKIGAYRIQVMHNKIFIFMR